MADPEDKAAEDEKAKKAAADKAAREATEPQQPAPSQEEADTIKDRARPDQNRDMKAQSTKAGYKTR
jgi:hypothetical protein